MGSLNCRPGGIWLLWMLALLFLGNRPSLAASEDRAVISIAKAQVVISDSLSIPDESAGWQTVSLPHRVPKPADRDLVGYWYKAAFVVQDASEPLWLHFPKLRSGGSIFLNGQQIEEIRGADRDYQVRWFRPHLFYVPPMAIKKGQNEIAVRLVIREPLTSFGEFFIGPQRPVRAAFERLLFWEHTSTTIACAICLLAGILILIFWLRRRNERLYGIFGVCVMFWGLRTFVFQMPEVRMEYWTFWRFCYYFTTAGFISCITIFLIGFSGSSKPFLNRFLVASWLCGSFLFLAIGPSIRLLMDAYWIASFLPFTLYAVVRLWIFAIRERTPSSISMVLAIVFGVGLAVHDYAVQHGLFHVNEFYLLHLGIPAFLLVMACVLMERFIDSLGQAESMNEKLAERISLREQELSSSYERLTALERQHAATEERQRIMQDMHDGVGSQLLTTLVMARRGAATSEDMVAMLQECLDDMRLSIDSLSPDDPELLSALGNFRFRMESRFKAVGVELRWFNHDLPDSLEIAPHAGLQVLRVLQEALTNVIKHAHATVAEVHLSFSPDSIRIRIQDNGAGFDGQTNQTGRGINNMQARAKKIGALFEVKSSPSGAAVYLKVPLGKDGDPLPRIGDVSMALASQR